jgi:hypothetical protein
MSNPVPLVPVIAAGLVGNQADADESQLPTNNDELDDGETTDSQTTVEEDEREADAVNDKLSEPEQGQDSTDPDSV